MAGSRLSPKAEELYAKLEGKPISHVFAQKELLACEVTKTAEELVVICQELYRFHLFVLLELERTVCWRRRPRELAERLRALPEQRDPMIVYTTIENADKTGIWVKSLKARTGIPQANLTKVLKMLESRSLVKQVKSSKNPGRKVYMLTGLDPGEDITGGPWYTDGELDVALIEAVAEIIRHFVRERSWREGPKIPSAIVSGLKTGDPNIVRMHPDLRLAEISEGKRLRVPRAPGLDFPTIADIHTNIEATGVVRKELTEPDVLQILDMMVYDGQIERHGPREALTATDDVDDEPHLPRNGVRPEDLPTARKRKRSATPSEASDDDLGLSSASQTTYHYIPRPITTDIESLPPPYRAYLSARGPGTGFSTTPCGRCPSFRLCEAGGPVDAESCAYLDAWLEEPREEKKHPVGVSVEGGEDRRKKGRGMVVLGENGKSVKVERDEGGGGAGGGGGVESAPT